MIAIAIAVDSILGIAFAEAQHIPVADGLYYAITTASTVGYGDITPKGWVPHLIAVLMMFTVIPLFASAYSLVTASLTTEHIVRHIDRRHEELREARQQ